MKKYIIWFKLGCDDDFAVITSTDKISASAKFHLYHSNEITEIHEIEDSNPMEFC